MIGIIVTLGTFHSCSVSSSSTYYTTIVPVPLRVTFGLETHECTIHGSASEQMERVWSICIAADFVNYLYHIVHCSLVHPSAESDHKEYDYITIQSFTLYCQYM